VNLPGLARIGQLTGWRRPAGEQAGPAAGRRLAILMWFLAIPLGLLLDRRRPADAARYVA
jgi:hypothetical protein